MSEATSLAMHIWKYHYKDISPNFELCDTPAGVLTQIDNMYTGLRDEIINLKTKLSRAEESLRDSQAKLARYQEWEGAVEVGGEVESEMIGRGSWIDHFVKIGLPERFEGQRVKVLVREVKEES